jgi:two-component system, LytTR family, sensor kinase
MRSKFPRILSHVAAWLAILAIPFLMAPPPTPPPDLDKFQFDVEPIRLVLLGALNGLLICFFYGNYYLLIPRLWTKRKRWPYFISIFVCYLTVELCVWIIVRLIIPQVFLTSEVNAIHNIGFFASSMLFVLSWAASSGIRLGMEWQETEERRKESENARLKAELLQLKSQLNPHFLFNTLNGIYTLTLAKNDAAPEAVLKLSHLLRYVMTEAEADWVPLENDLDHLQHFIDLHKMRLTSQTPVSFNVTGDTAGKQIAPLLLLPFVENAFKFGSSARELSPIELSLSVHSDTLEFTCKNRIQHALGDSTGIGIANTKRRLELMYPGRYQLEITADSGTFSVFLRINHLQPAV